MPVLTNVQIRSVAKFLKASCDKVPLSSPPPKLGQWLDILSREFGFRDWNVTCASNREEPELVSTNPQSFPISVDGFLGLARVVSPDAPPTHYLCYSENGELSRFETAAKLGEKIRSQMRPAMLRGDVTFTRPDGMAEGQLELSWKNRDQGCPIVIKTDEQGTTILLWWLSPSFLLNDPITLWWRLDRDRSSVRFSDEGDIQLFEYGENSLNPTLTELFLETVTGKNQPRRTCWCVPKGPDSSMTPAMLLIEEGNPNTLQVVEASGSEGWDVLRAESEKRNKGLGLSKLDCEAIISRFRSAEIVRDEEDITEYSGVYDD